MELEQMLSLVDKRREGFNLMVDATSALESPLIVETGCARQENNFQGDGMSTLIWDAVANRTNGSVISVDLNPMAVSFASARVGPRTKVYNADSVVLLRDLEIDLIRSGKKIDLLYLDSYDFDAHNPHPSSLHHIFELLSIKQALRPGTLVAVDDNFEHNGQWIGKGAYVAQWMANVNKKMVYRGYQWIWEW
jgi:predicted O-methyltransferase YrrM